MKQVNQKLKLLYLMRYLLENTDENHGVTVKEMIEELARYGVSAERKSIYDDLECLRLYGLDICFEKSKYTRYAVVSRDFELPELKLLVDSVQASKFITRNKSLQLISKIEQLTSKHGGKKLHRQVYVLDRVKVMNERIYYNVDILHEAIEQNKQVRFLYFKYDVHKQRVYGKGGGVYMESPVALTWADENYYLITYKAKYGNYTHYRVDKMEEIQITDDERILPEEKFDLSAYAQTMFSMFGGEETVVSIRFDNSLASVVFDRFGMDIPIEQVDDKHFVCRVCVSVSPQFLSWIMSFGDKAKILSPDAVVEKIKEQARGVMRNYRKKRSDAK